MDKKNLDEDEAAVKPGRHVFEDRSEFAYEDRDNAKDSTVDLKLLELDPKRYRLIHETFEKRTYQETPLKLDEPTWQYIEDTNRTGRLIHEVVIRRCYEEIKDEDEGGDE